MNRSLLTIPPRAPVHVYPRLRIGSAAAVDPASRLAAIPTGSGQEALAAQRELWGALRLRQDWADEAFMRAHLKAARLKVKYSSEPATVQRLRSLLRKAGISLAEAQVSVGTDLQKYLLLNPDLPLWAAVASILEATGRFTPEAGA